MINPKANDIPISEQLWDAGQCAELFHMARTSFLQYKAVLPGFPKPVQKKPKLWIPSEIMEWIKTNRVD